MFIRLGCCGIKFQVFNLNGKNCQLTLYCLAFSVGHLQPKCLLQFKKGSSKVFRMSVDTKRAYLWLCPEKLIKKNSGSKGLNRNKHFCCFQRIIEKGWCRHLVHDKNFYNRGYGIIGLSRV